MHWKPNNRNIIQLQNSNNLADTKTLSKSLLYYYYIFSMVHVFPRRHTAHSRLCQHMQHATYILNFSFGKINILMIQNIFLYIAHRNTEDPILRYFDF